MGASEGRVLSTSAPGAERESDKKEKVRKKKKRESSGREERRGRGERSDPFFAGVKRRGATVDYSVSKQTRAGPAAARGPRAPPVA